MHFHMNGFHTKTRFETEAKLRPLGNGLLNVLCQVESTFSKCDHYCLLITLF